MVQSRLTGDEIFDLGYKRELDSDPYFDCIHKHSAVSFPSCFDIITQNIVRMKTMIEKTLALVLLLLCKYQDIPIETRYCRDLLKINQSLAQHTVHLHPTATHRQRKSATAGQFHPRHPLRPPTISTFASKLPQTTNGSPSAPALA